MTTNQKKHFIAFISYNHTDEKLAKWLHNKIESSGFPSAMRKENPNLPPKVRPVFRDIYELSSGNLKEEISKELNDSKFLIVICSPNSAKSRWVASEVQQFIDWGLEDHIIPFIVGGIPHASDPTQECLPEPLRCLSEDKEILGININDMGRDAAAIKAVARMFNVRFDKLWQRHERAKRRKNTLYAVLTAISVLAAIVMGHLYNVANEQTKLAVWNNRHAENQRDRALAEYAKQLISDDCNGASLIALRLLERNINNAEAEAVLRSATMIGNLTLRGHTSWINSLSFSSDSASLASASDDCTVKLWDLNDGSCIKTFRFDSPVEIVHYTPTNNRLLCVTSGGDCYTYNTINGVFTTKTHILYPIHKACISYDGDIIAVGNNQGEIKVVNLNTNTTIYTGTISEGMPVGAFALSANGNSLCYHDDWLNNIIKINLLSGRKHTKHFNSICESLGMNADGTQLMAGFANGTKILNADLTELKSVPFSTIYSVNYFNQKNKTIAVTGSDNGIITIWDTECYIPQLMHPVSNQGISSITIHPQQRHIAYCDCHSKDAIKILDTWALKQISEYPVLYQHQSGNLISSSDVAELGKDIYLATTTQNSLEIHKFIYDETIRINSLSTDDINYSRIKSSPSGKYFIAKSISHPFKLFVWESETGNLITSFMPNDGNDFSFSFCGNTDGVFTRDESTVNCWDLSRICNSPDYNAVPNSSYKYSNDPKSNDFPIASVDDCAIDSQGNLYIIASDEKTIKTVNLKTGKAHYLPFKTDSEHISYLTLSPSGKYLSFTDANRRITIYDIAKRKVHRQWVAHSALISEHRWHPSEKYIISSSFDGTTNIWETASAVCIVKLPKKLEDVRFSNDGNAIFGHADYNFFICPFPDLNTLIHQQKQRFAKRKLTSLERQIYHLD